MGLAGLRDALREGNRRGASSEEVANLLLERAGAEWETAPRPALAVRLR